MAWWHAFTQRRMLPTAEIGEPLEPWHSNEPQMLAASAAAVKEPRTDLIRTNARWQDEAWGYYDDLGEFRYGVEWVSAMLSRVRLVAARIEPGTDEPVRADTGPAVDLMTTLAGGVAAQAELMSALATQLAVPGEGYLVGESVSGVEQWSVRSTDEVRAARGHFEVADETSSKSSTQWRPLSADSLVTRVWRPHRRWHYVADSPARAARSTMRELELVNRHITAQYLSRLASAGMVVFPDEITFPVREEFADAPDPFMAEWIEIAAEAIRTPGTAAATIPLPIKVPGEWIDKIKHLDFTLKLDEKILDKRDSAIKRLAIQLNIPAEVLLGMSDLNHWGIWGMEEAALKTNIAPEAELIAQALTTGYLQPRLKASGVQDWQNWVVWYDMSELTLRPDRSSDAIKLYDRLEINGDALRRESGFDAADEPVGEELREQALKVIIRTLPSGSESALSALSGEQPGTTTPSGQPEQPEPPPEDRSLPDTLEAPPPSADTARGRTERAIRQANSPHAVEFSISRPPRLLHPKECAQHAYSCPYTHAAANLHNRPKPGAPGIYETSLDPFGMLIIGRRASLMDTTGLISTFIGQGKNGFAHTNR